MMHLQLGTVYSLNACFILFFVFFLAALRRCQLLQYRILSSPPFHAMQAALTGSSIVQKNRSIY